MSQKNFKQQSRMRLYGKQATDSEITREITHLLLGDRKGQESQSVTQVAKSLGFTRQTIYNYIAKAVEVYKILELDEDGKAKLPEKTIQQDFKRFSESHPVTTHPLVIEWKKNLLTRKQGKPIASWKIRIRNLQNWLNTLKINPEQCLISLETTDKYQENFLELFREGKADVEYHKDPAKVNIQKIAYQYSQAYRDFMNFHKMPYPKNWGGVSSQRVVGHGQYSDVKLTDEELQLADKWLKDKYGIDSDEFRLFWMGVESCGRNKAVFNMTLDYEKDYDEVTKKTVYVMSVIESKTSHVKGGKWKKYITNPDLQKSIDLLKSRGVNKIYESDLQIIKLKVKIRDVFLELYKFLGKETIHDGYFMKHYFHVLRHVGAHYWLRKTEYQYYVVAKAGGWIVIKELVDSYGEMPAKYVMRSIFGKKTSLEGDLQ